MKRTTTWVRCRDGPSCLLYCFTRAYPAYTFRDIFASVNQTIKYFSNSLDLEAPYNSDPSLPTSPGPMNHSPSPLYPQVFNCFPLTLTR